MKVAVLFPGYGSQFVGMGKELYDESRVVQEFFEEASACLPVNFVKLCFASSDIDICKISHAYPALFLVSASIFEILKQAGIVPDVTVGCFGGEYAAMYASESMSFPDGLYLLHKFSGLYQDFLAAGQFGAMRVMGISARKLAQWCSEVSDATTSATIAGYDDTQDFLVTGHVQALDRLQEKITESDDATSKTVPVELGLHSGLMDEVARGLTMYLEKVDFKQPRYPIMSSTTGKMLQEPEELRDFVINSIVEPVRLDKIVKALEAYDVILEVGPESKICVALRERYPEKQVFSVIKPADIQLVKQLLVPEPSDQQEQKTE